MYHGSSTARQPPNIVCNGVYPTYITGDSNSVANQRTSVASYEFKGSDFATISGQTLISDGGFSQNKSIEYSILQNASQASIVNKNFGTAASGTITLPLTRSANSITIARGFSSIISSSLNFTDPSRQGTVFSSRVASYANTVDTARTADFTSSTSGAYTRALVFNVESETSFAINSLNGGANVLNAGAVNTASVTGYAPTSGTVGNLTLTSVSTTTGVTTFTIPWFTEGEIYPAFGTSQTLTLTEGVDSAIYSATFTAPANRTVTVVATPDNLDVHKLGYHFELAGYPPVNGDTIITLTSELTTSPDTSVSAPVVPVTTVVAHRVNSTGRVYLYTVNAGVGGIVTVTPNSYFIGLGIGIGFGI